ncbi:MAG: xylulokinase [Microbacteriaceae bacterium]|nr:xylulokinase [Microbacteriaceae bacterium]
MMNNNPRERYTLGVDIGTASSKGVLVDARGTIIAVAAVTHDVAMPRPGYFEQDADLVWWADFRALVATLLAESGVAGSQISGIGVSAIGPCVLPVDEAGTPLRPGILYGIDTRAGEEIAELKERFGDRDPRVLALDSQSVAPKILWLQHHEPEVWARTHRILGAEGYIIQKLTGEAVVDVYDASAAYAPLIDASGSHWSEEYSELCDGSLLPRLAWGCEVIGAVTPEAADATGLVAGTPVVAGTADAAAEALSAGMRDEGDLMIMYGTSAFFILRTHEAPASTRFWPSHFHEPGSHVLSGGMGMAGGLVAWTRDILGRHLAGGEELEFADLTALALESVPGANGLLVLPYLVGERTPFFDPDARGALLGLTVRHTRADICRAVLESIAYGIRHNVESMREEGNVVKRVLAVGGGTQNLLLMHIVSDVCGFEQSLPAQQVGASLGDALRAAVGIGTFRSLTDAVSTVALLPPVEPDGTSKGLYDRMFELYKAGYHQTAAISHALAAIEAAEQHPTITREAHPS